MSAGKKRRETLEEENRTYQNEGRRANRGFELKTRARGKKVFSLPLLSRQGEKRERGSERWEK